MTTNTDEYIIIHQLGCLCCGVCWGPVTKKKTKAGSERNYCPHCKKFRNSLLAKHGSTKWLYQAMDFAKLTGKQARDKINELFYEQFEDHQDLLLQLYPDNIGDR
jgi:hypothetical protein